MTFTTRKTEEIELPVVSFNTKRHLKVIRYGKKGSGLKTYIQAGLHADEPPGFLVMHHLMKLLDQADKAGKIQGEILLVPAANPIGLSQWTDNRLQGRFELNNGVNFNRNYPDLTDKVAERIESRLTSNPDKNIRMIRKALLACLSEQSPVDEGDYLKHQLLSMAVDADIVLDLHCDFEACMHVYMGTALWPDGADLSAQIGSKVTLLADDSGGEPFDEACSKTWWELAKMFPESPIPPACLSATIELRGSSDVTHEYGETDAKNIFEFLKRRGYIKGKVSKLPKLPRAATPLAGVEHIKADRPGVIVYRKKIGELVKKGEVVAEIINPLEESPNKRITRIKAVEGGFLFTQLLDRYARPNRIIAKIAGKKAIEGKGAHLLTA